MMDPRNQICADFLTHSSMIFLVGKLRVILLAGTDASTNRLDSCHPSNITIIHTLFILYLKK